MHSGESSRFEWIFHQHEFVLSNETSINISSRKTVIIIIPWSIDSLRATMPGNWKIWERIIAIASVRIFFFIHAACLQIYDWLLNTAFLRCAHLNSVQQTRNVWRNKHFKKANVFSRRQQHCFYCWRVSLRKNIYSTSTTPRPFWFCLSAIHSVVLKPSTKSEEMLELKWGD